jgi:hypothetical protein
MDFTSDRPIQRGDRSQFAVGLDCCGCIQECDDRAGVTADPIDKLNYLGGALIRWVVDYDRGIRGSENHLGFIGIEWG